MAHIRIQGVSQEEATRLVVLLVADEYPSDQWGTHLWAKVIIFSLPNARPVGCRSTTLLAYSLSSFCTNCDHFTHSHTHTHAYTHTETQRHTPCSATSCPVGCSWQQDHDGWSLSLRGSSFHLLSLDRTGAASLVGQGLWETCSCVRIRPFMHKHCDCNTINALYIYYTQYLVLCYDNWMLLPWQLPWQQTASIRQ